MSDLNSASKVWDINEVDLKNIETHVKKTNFKHGIFSSIPLICRGEGCPYKEVCSIEPTERPINKRCVIEIAAIVARFDSWCNHFGIKIEGEQVEEKDAVDVALIRDLIDNEIQVVRAENKIAISGDFIGKVIADVDKFGEEHYEDTVTPEAQFKMTLLDKRYKILQLLNSTRKDKASDKDDTNPSEKAAGIFEDIAKRLSSKMKTVSEEEIQNED